MSNNQPEVETLKFKIGLSGTYWKKRPAFDILVNDDLLVRDQISKPTDEVQYVEFTKELVNDADFTLTIKLTNKDNSDVVKEPPEGEPFTIVQDLLLNIVSIEIDDINIGELMWSKSTFTAEDGQHPVLLNCVNLGWNGSYSITFRSPFYFWLLENM